MTAFGGLCLLVVILWTQKVFGSGVLNMSYVVEKDGVQQTKYAEFCVISNPALSPFPSPKKPKVWWKLNSQWDKDLCNFEGIVGSAERNSGAIMVVRRSNCTVYEHAIQARKSGAAGVMIVPLHDTLVYPARGASVLEDFPVLVMSRETLNHGLNTLGSWNNRRVSVSSAGPPSYWGQVCVVATAIAVLCVGAFCAGTYRYRRIVKRFVSTSTGFQSGDASDNAKVSFVFGVPQIVIFFFIYIGLFALLYLMLKYFDIGLMVMYAPISTCYVALGLRLLFSWTRFGSRRVQCCHTRKEFCSSFDMRDLVFLMIGASITAAWMVFREKWFSWIIGDVIGAFAIIGILTVMHLWNLKVATVMLILLFIYDVSIVFIGPLLTGNPSLFQQFLSGDTSAPDDSIVFLNGNGDGDRKTPPTTFEMPYIPSGDECADLGQTGKSSHLGFMDVVAPGLVISYLRAFELTRGITMIYSIPSVIGSAISLSIAILSTVLFESEQPGLFYIAPILLVVVHGIAWKRGELKLLWQRDLDVVYREKVADMEVTLSEVVRPVRMS